jgi:hypothetical protein
MTVLFLALLMLVLMLALETMHAVEKNQEKASNTRRMRASSVSAWCSCTVGDRWLMDEQTDPNNALGAISRRPWFRRRV